MRDDELIKQQQRCGTNAEVWRGRFVIGCVPNFVYNRSGFLFAIYTVHDRAVEVEPLRLRRAV
jgi:hypothetical protein